MFNFRPYWGFVNVSSGNALNLSPYLITDADDYEFNRIQIGTQLENFLCFDTFNNDTSITDSGLYRNSDNRIYYTMFRSIEFNTSFTAVQWWIKEYSGVSFDIYDYPTMQLNDTLDYYWWIIG